ncbi:MAG TPA: NAD(P)H-quinone oxidoreductase [Rhodospirillaceae bacterium]|nr:NAD(P)H-quinone oxidoreductase [Rhodospirillaceae bacterium]
MHFISAVSADADGLQIKTGPVPQPGAGQVLIRVAAAGVNRADILQRMGKYPPPQDASDIIGLEVSGEIIALGANVAQWRAGDMVCALLSGGGYAEYAVADAACCLPIPDSVSIVDAAGIPEVAFTAYSNLIMAGGLQPNETILIHAGASGVGTFAIQLAHAHGARIFATVGSPEKQIFCKDLGAEAVINYRTEDFLPTVQRLTDGKGVDMILDVLGGSATEKNIDLLATGGRLIVIACPDGARAQINLVRLMQKRLQLRGTTLRSRPLAEKAEIAAHLQATIWPMFANKKLRPVIYQTLKLSEAAIAHRIMESRQNIGKLVLTVG